MTAIIALKDGKKIIVGADGVSTDDNYKYPVSVDYDSKVVRVDGSPDCLIACSGLCIRNRAIQKIKNLLDGKDDVNHDYIVNKTVPKIIRELDRKDLLVVEKDIKYFDSTIILATKKHLFFISGYGAVVEADSVAIAGIGEIPLLCKYDSLKESNLSLEDKAVECLKFAISQNNTIDYPLVIMENDASKETIVIKRPNSN